MPTFLHAADLHLDSPLRGLVAYDGAPVARIREATRVAFDRLIDLAIAEEVSGVVLAGDLYDVDPLAESALYFRSGMQRLADAGIRVAAVLGNHDHAGLAPKHVRLPENVHVFPSDAASSFAIAPDLVVHGRSYPRRDVNDGAFVDGYPARVPGCLNVGLLHTALEHTGVHQPYVPVSADRLRRMGYHYWALGHVHQRTTDEELQALDDIPVVFPGNLQGRHVHETGPKGAMLVGYEGTRVVSVRHVALDVVRWHHLVVDAAGIRDDEDPGVHVRDRLFAATAADRAAARVSAVRVDLAGVAAPNVVALTDDGLRDYLRGELQGLKDPTYLEKVRVRVRPADGEASTFEAALRGVAASIAADPTARAAFDAAARSEVRRQLREAAGRLDVFEAGELALTAEMPDDASTHALLERAVQLLRTMAR